MLFSNCMSCCAFQLLCSLTSQRQGFCVGNQCKDNGSESFVHCQVLYKVLCYLCSESLASQTFEVRHRRTYPYSATTALYWLHLRGEAVLLRIAIDIRSHGRAVVLLTVRTAIHERAHLSRSYKWGVMALHISERLNREWWVRIPAVTSCGIPW